MNTKFFASALLAGTAAAAIALAPGASASVSECQENGAASICQRPGHSAIYATPNEMGKANNGIGWPAGSGQMPSILALD